MKFLVLMRSMVAISVGVLGICFGSDAQAAATMATQPPCQTGGGACAIFSNTDVVPKFPPFTFNAPSNGVATVLFNGTMNCQNFNATVDSFHGVIDFSTQIVADKGGNANYTEAGGQRFATRIVPYNISDFSNGFNLTASRVVSLSQGRHVFRNLFTKNRMDPNIQCTLYNGNFSVIFFPN